MVECVASVRSPLMQYAAHHEGQQQQQDQYQYHHNSRHHTYNHQEVVANEKAVRGRRWSELQ